MKLRLMLFLLLCLLFGTGTCFCRADNPVQQKQLATEQKAREQIQHKKIRKEVRNYENLRNEAILAFSRAHQPTAIYTPGYLEDFRVTDVSCVGNKTTGDVVLVFSISPLRYSFRLYMGGEQNGTAAYARGKSYPASDMYGRVYTLRSGQSEQVTVSFYTIPEGVEVLDRVDVSMGLQLNLMNLIILRKVPIYWTYSDKTIRYFVEEAEKNQPNK